MCCLIFDHTNLLNFSLANHAVWRTRDHAPVNTKSIVLEIWLKDVGAVANGDWGVASDILLLRWIWCKI